MQKLSKIVHQDVKAWNFTWKVSMTLEVKNHSDPPACLCYWIFYRPESVFIGKHLFSLNVFILYTVTKLIENWAKNDKRVVSENGLVISYSCSKTVKQLEKITILIPVFSWECSCCKQSNCIHFKLLTFYIKSSV